MPTSRRPVDVGVRLPPDSTLLGIGCLGLAGLALAGVYTVSDGQVGVPCLLRMTTGLDCPFCGATRMAAALLQGDAGAAVRFNAPLLVGGVVVAYLWTAWVLQRLGVARLPRPRPTARLRRLLMPVLVTVAVTFAVVRNLPWPPFTGLYV